VKAGALRARDAGPLAQEARVVMLVALRAREVAFLSLEPTP